MRILLAIALVLGIVDAAGMYAAFSDVTDQLQAANDTNRSLSQENSNLSLRNYELLLLTSTTSPNVFATKFAGSLCAGDTDGFYASLSPGAKQRVDVWIAGNGFADHAAGMQALMRLPGTCTGVTYKGGYIAANGNAVILYVLTMTNGTQTWGVFYAIEVSDTGVEGVS